MDKGNWSRDWTDFDWKAVEEKIGALDAEHGKGQEKPDIGINEEEFLEYFSWLHENNPEEYNRAVLYIILRQNGVTDDRTDYWLEHPEELQDILKRAMDKDKD